MTGDYFVLRRLQGLLLKFVYKFGDKGEKQ